MLLAASKCCVVVNYPSCISSAIVRELGTSFCKMDPGSLTDVKLNAKKMTKRTVGKPKSKKGKAFVGKPVSDEAGPSKSADQDV